MSEGVGVGAGELKPGMSLRHQDGKVVRLKERKADDSGWWLEDNQGGLADHVIADRAPYWTVLGFGAHAECPLCTWVSSSWGSNYQRKVAMEEWDQHKLTHTNFGPRFVRDAPA
jgi:hypothetical protein